MKIGIIAEDESDVGVLQEITLSMLRPHRIGFKHFIGHGCGKIRRKCRAWAEALTRSDCEWIVVLHDLDERDETQLRSQLTQSLKGITSCGSVVLIPRKEIEAWLLYDPEAIARVFGQHIVPKLPGNPESLNDPKRYLRDLIWKNYKKDYINTLHNVTIARGIRPAKLRSCGSFQAHPEFVRRIRNKFR